MPVFSRVDPELNMIYVMVYGCCTIADLFEHERQYRHTSERRPNMKIVVDFFLGDIDIDLQGIKSAVSYIHDLNDAGWELEPTAVLTHNRLIDSLNQAYELMVNDVKVKSKVFSSLKFALYWLDMSEFEERIAQIQACLVNEARLSLQKA